MVRWGRSTPMQVLAGLFVWIWLLLTVAWAATFWTPSRRAIARAVLAPRHIPLRRAQWSLAIAAIAAFVLLAATVPKDQGKHTAAAPAPSAARTDTEPLEQQLATIDDGYVAADDIRVARFRNLLDQLSETSSSSKQQIADQTVKCQELLKDRGIKESLVNIMEGMNKVFASSTQKKQYSEWLAAYVVLREKSTSHDDAIKSLESLGQAFGG
jgi:hypothetical protein